MTDRELMQLALDCLENAVDSQQSEIDMHILHYGEWYRPERVKFMKEYLNKTNQSIEAIRARIAEPPKDLELPLVRPEEFVKLIQGKENFWGIPVMRTEWPTPEPKAQFEFQEYGPPNWGESQVTKPEFVAEQKAMNEGLRKMVEQEPVAWGVDEGEGRCIDLHDVYFVPTDAEHMAELKGNHAKVIPLYTAPPQREWVGLTAKDLAEIPASCYEGAIWADAKLKQKNT